MFSCVSRQERPQKTLIANLIPCEKVISKTWTWAVMTVVVFLSILQCFSAAYQSPERVQWQIGS